MIIASCCRSGSDDEEDEEDGAASNRYGYNHHVAIELQSYCMAQYRFGPMLAQKQPCCFGMG